MVVVVVAVVVLSATTSAALASPIPRGEPAELGFSSQRLDLLRKTVKSWVDRGDIAGAVTAIVRRGQLVQLETYGYLDLETKRPMTEDALFRIASMTKTFTSVALMTLYEEARLSLDDPVSKYLPAFSETQVGVFSDRGELIETRPPRRAMTVVDLLRHTSGLSYGSPAGLGALYDREQVRSGTLALPEVIQRLAALPLAEDPGTRFHYSLSTDVLGRLIEVAAEEPLEDVLKKRVFGPLGLEDTMFVVPDQKLDRLVNLYAYRDDRLVLAESAEDSPLRRPPAAISGGGGWGDTGSLGGAVTTARDYLRFLLMLEAGGRLDGVRILGRKSVELMTMDHLGDLDGPYPGAGFGLGFGITRDPGDTHELGTAGSYFWGGSENTGFWVDPEEELIGLFFTQLSPFGHADVIPRYRTLVYQALE